MNVKDKKSKIKRNIYYKDPFDFEFKEMIKSIKNEKNDINEKIELITSYIPGSTLKSQKVQIPKIGFKCYDTPGLLNPSQPFNFIKNLHILKFINFSDEITPLKISLNSQKSVWMGSLIRIDNLSENNNVNITALFSNKISLYNIDMKLSNDFYKKNYGVKLFPTFLDDIKVL